MCINQHNMHVFTVMPYAYISSKKYILCASRILTDPFGRQQILSCFNFISPHNVRNRLHRWPSSAHTSGAQFGLCFGLCFFCLDFLVTICLLGFFSLRVVKNVGTIVLAFSDYFTPSCFRSIPSKTAWRTVCPTRCTSSMPLVARQQAPSSRASPALPQWCNAGWTWPEHRDLCLFLSRETDRQSHLHSPQSTKPSLCVTWQLFSQRRKTLT